MIRFENVCKSYDKKNYVLKDFNITINDGEFVFVMGPSGAGKTTFTKLLLLEEKVSSGRIFMGNDNGESRIDNLPQRKIPYLRRSMGFIFQDFRLFENKTVYENVAYAMEILGEPTSVIKKNVPLALEIVGLSGKEDAMPSMLSGGQKQRLCVARAIVNKPSVIVADEPTGNLDGELAREIMDLLIKIKEYGKTVIVVTHAAELVNSYNERVVTIMDGCLTEDRLPTGAKSEAKKDSSFKVTESEEPEFPDDIDIMPEIESTELASKNSLNNISEIAAGNSEEDSDGAEIGSEKACEEEEVK